MLDGGRDAVVRGRGSVLGVNRHRREQLLIFFQCQQPVLTAVFVELLQRVGEQRKSVVVARVLDKALAEPGLEAQAAAVRRPFNDLAEARLLHGIEGDLLVAFRGALELLKSVQEIRAHGGQDHHAACCVGARVQQQPERNSGIRSLGGAEDLLELVEDE